MGLDPRWQQIFSTRAWGKYPAEEFIRFLAGHYYQVPERHAVKVFEAGFGTGANLWYAAREGFTVCGLEGAQAGWELACARLDAEVPAWREHGADLRVGDLCRPLPWPDASFDVVLDSVAVTCNGFEEGCGIYRELHRVCRPGGRLYVRTPATGTWGEGTGRPFDQTPQGGLKGQSHPELGQWQHGGLRLRGGTTRRDAESAAFTLLRRSVTMFTLLSASSITPTIGAGSLRMRSSARIGAEKSAWASL